MKKVNIWTLVETSSDNDEILSKLNCSFIIKIDNYNHRAHLFEFSFPSKLKLVWKTSHVQKCTTVKTYDDKKEIMTIETNNNIYKFELNCRFYPELIHNSFKESVGGKLFDNGRMEDRGDIYEVKDYKIELRYLSHVDINGKEYLSDEPENVWISKYGTCLYSIDDPSLKDLVNIFRYADSESLEGNLKEFDRVYSYATNSYIE